MYYYYNKVTQSFRDLYSEINPATLTGAIDVIVVQQEDGSFKSSPFHVRFGKMALIKTKDLTVDISINGQPIDLFMKLGEDGEAQFDEESESSPPPSQPTVFYSSSGEDEEKSNSPSIEKTRVKSSLEPPSQQQQQQKLRIKSSPAIAISKSTKTTGEVNASRKSNSEDNDAAGAAAGTSVPHFFSDGEITPEMGSPRISRPESPKSDTEADLINSAYSNMGSKSKKNRLTSDQIAELNLNPGANEIIYSVTTALQGTTRITSYIFLWNFDEKVVVSDIDGTITKSDVWGQVLPIFGRDWTQTGVADLYSAIERNQYKFIYLSARAIGQSGITRSLLNNINQGGLTLPNGPLLVTPTSLIAAFQKEVIEKKPEEFKISCLQDVRSLFPVNQNPFYAGYGNKTSDVLAYKTVGIPVSRIFTINRQGHLKHEVSRTFQSSYSNLCDFVDLIFPPLKPSASIIKAEYDSFNFWRNNQITDDVMAEIDAEMKKNLALAALAASEKKASKSSRSKAAAATTTQKK